MALAKVCGRLSSLRSSYRPVPLSFTAIPSRRSASTIATFHYLQPLEIYKTEKPYHINVPQGGIPGHEHTNEISRPHHGINVFDIRGREEEFSLDKQGFQVVTDESADMKRSLDTLDREDFPNSNLVRKRLGPLMEQLIREKLQAESVVTFAFRYRRRDSQFPQLSRGTNAKVAQPVQGVHADFTPDYARVTAQYVGQKIQDLDLKNRRWQFISAWRPLVGPLYDWPLALLDTSSLSYKRDLIASDNVYPHQVSETYNVFHHPEHRWHYLSGQMRQEFFFFKAFDSRTKGGIARVCAHAAFQLPNVPPDTPPRESIECVSLVLYPKGTAEENPEETLPSETPVYLKPTGAFSFD